MPSYSEWLEEIIEGSSSSGAPVTRREYYERFFNDIDPKRIYEQDAAVTKRLVERGAITDE